MKINLSLRENIGGEEIVLHDTIEVSPEQYQLLKEDPKVTIHGIEKEE